MYWEEKTKRVRVRVFQISAIIFVSTLLTEIIARIILIIPKL